jgi:hypothetical protein
MSAEIREQIGWDYSETVRRHSSAETWKIFTDIMVSFYQLEENDPRARLAMALLEDVGIGESAGLVTHHEADFRALASTLSELHNPLKVVNIACPHYRWELGADGLYRGDTTTLDSQVPGTVETMLRYLPALKNRAERYGQEIHLRVIFATWELTRSDFLADVNGGISSKAALKLLEKSRASTQEKLDGLSSPHFSIETGTDLYEDFHSHAQQIAEQALASEHKLLSHLLETRGHYYSNGVEDAARDLGEAKTAFSLAGNSGDIILVTTSPTMSRACLSGGTNAWVQLSPRYHG